MLKGFRDFILRGNVVDLAVAVVMGTAFNDVVKAFVSSIITPLISAAGGKPDFHNLVIHANGAIFTIGDLINAVISFLIIAASVYFFLVLPVNALLNRFKKPVPATPPATRPCPQCLSDIPLAATRCAHCTQPVPAATPAV
ncbi:MAG TPA: large conductance mechanosensitive channel protein MscL [Terracidiphilus sp.]